MSPDHDQHGQGQHRQGDVPVPADPRADFVFVEARQLFGLLEAFLDGPAATGDFDDPFQRGVLRGMREIVRDVGGVADRAPDQPTPPATNFDLPGRRPAAL